MQRVRLSEGVGLMTTGAISTHRLRWVLKMTTGAQSIWMTSDMMTVRQMSGLMMIERIMRGRVFSIVTPIVRILLFFTIFAL